MTTRKHVKIPIYQQKQSNLIKIFLVAEVLHSEFNGSLEASVFPPIIKLTNVTPVHKKGTSSEKDNYRPISIILLNLLKYFLDRFLQARSRCLLVLLEKWSESLDQVHVFGPLQNNFSNTFDCFPHKVERVWF